MDAPALSRHAAALRERGDGLVARGAFLEAALVLDGARLVAEACGDERRLAEAHLSLGRAHNFVGELSLAEAHFNEAAASFSAMGAHDETVGAAARVAFIDYERGALDAAEARLRSLTLVPQATGASRGLVLGYLGNVQRARRELTAAARLYEDAERSLAGDARYAATFRMDAAIAKILAGAFGGDEGRAAAARSGLASARSDLAAARRDLEGRDLTVSELIGHYEFVAGCLAGEGRALAPLPPEMPHRRSQFLASARALFHRAVRRGERSALVEPFGALRAACPDYAHGRIAISLLEQLLADGGARGALTVAADGTWCRLDEGPVIDLAEHGAARRILLALVRAGGRPLALAELIEAGWPGERIVPAAAKNRVHVTLHALRRRGLRAVLERGPAGIRLAAPVRTVA